MIQNALFVPAWIEKGDSHDERLEQRPSEKSYPLLCMSNHPRWRMHAQADDITWTREISTMKVKGPDGYFYEPVWLSPVEAAARGIANGDVVKVYNERGAVLGGAYVTERLRTRVAYMDHGARWDPIVPGELDRGGAIQHHHAAQHHLEEGNRDGGERLPRRSGEGDRRGDGALAQGLSGSLQQKPRPRDGRVALRLAHTILVWTSSPG